MASAFTRLFSPSHRKRASSSSSSRRQESTRTRFPTSSTFDLRHSIPEESFSATDPAFPSSASVTKLTVDHLNHHLSAPISDATLRRRSLAIDATHANSTLRPSLPRSFSALDITSPLDASINANSAFTPPSSQPPSPPPVDDDDDFDSNPLYLHLSEHPQLANDWSIASLALIPLARTITSHHAITQDDLQDPHFIALHAFAPSRLYKDQFVSVRSLKHSKSSPSATTFPNDGYDWAHVTLTATLDSDQRSLTITETTHAPRPSSQILSLSTDSASAALRSASTIKRKVTIVSETTIYRTLPTPRPATASPDQSAFQVTSRSHPPSSDAPPLSTKVRVLSVDLPIVQRRAQGAGADSSYQASHQHAPPPLDSTEDELHASISDLILEHVPPKRLFAHDLSLLAQPSVGSTQLAEALTNAFQVLFSAAHQFSASFVYVKGFDSYNAHRIRRGIWFKAWKAFEERLGSDHIARLSVEAFHRIKSLLENIVMGLVHSKMYGPIQDQLMDADLVTDDVLCAYNAFNVTLADFGVQNVALRQRPARLATAIDVLSQGLDDDGGTQLDDALAQGDMQLLTAILNRPALSPIPVVAQSASLDQIQIQSDLGLAILPHRHLNHGTSHGELHRRTPLQILQTLRTTIDEIGWAADRHPTSSGRRASSSHERPPPLGTDDLLPILSFVFVRARPGRLCSMLYYARTFQLTDTATSPELQWALITCDAVVAYLRTDPLRLCRRSSSGSIVADPSRKGSRSHSGAQPGVVSANDSLSVRSMSSRSHQGSAAASTLQAATLMARSPSAVDGAGFVQAASPRSPHSPRSPRSTSPSAEASNDHLAASSSNSYFFRHADVSTEHVAHATSEASPRLHAEGFKLPGLPASVSSRRNSRILQQRPTSVFSLSEDGDAISLLPDTSLDALERRSSLATSQSPSRRLTTRDRTFSSSSSSTSHNDVQIRPQIVRTIKRSQAGNICTINRLERTSSNGSTASSSQIHVRVVGSSSTRPVETSTANEPAVLANASPARSDRRRSFDSWTAFSLFSSSALCGASANVATEETSSIDVQDVADVAHASTLSDGHGNGKVSEHATHVSRGSVGSAETGTSSGWLYWRTELNGASRRSSVSAHAKGASLRGEGDGAPGAKTVAVESDDANCQPEGVETPEVAFRRSERAASVRSSASRASRASGSDFGAPGQWASTEASATGSVSSRRASVQRGQYRGRLLSTSAALAVSAVPLAPHVDRSGMSTADLTRPTANAQSIGSLNAFKASLHTASFVVTRRDQATDNTHDHIPDMIAYGTPKLNTTHTPLHNPILTAFSPAPDSSSPSQSHANSHTHPCTAPSHP